MTKYEKVGKSAGHPASWTVDVLGLDTAPVPVTGCTSPEYFQKEVEHIFKKVWFCVGREEEIPNPGDYFIWDFKAIKASIIIVRGKDRKVRAFHNVCSHRCNKVTWSDRGNLQRLYCQFHGWTYGLDGQLLNVPDEKEFFNFNKADHALTPVSADVWKGFIFINADPNPKETLPQYLGHFYEGLSQFPFEEMTHCYAWRLNLNCNYKIIKDAFSEIYHVPFIHVLSVAKAFVNQERRMPHVLKMDIDNHSLRLSMYGNPKHVPPPGTGIAYKHGTSVVKRNEGDDDKLPPFMNPTRTDSWAGDLMQVFPSFHFTVFQNSYIYLNYIPVAEDKCEWELRLYLRPPRNASERFSQEYAAIELRDSILEDSRTVEYTQSVLSSGAKTHFHFSDQEALARAHHLMTQAMAGPYPEPGK
jgi:phenylpropionate dioxygenase-like ring-hydroxylating dioxygenase large terminal subunit